MISGTVVIDASVVVEYLVDLGQARWASLLFCTSLDADQGAQLWAPDLVFPETASALRKLVARRCIDARAGEWAVAKLSVLPLTVSGTADLMREAWKLRGDVTIYDACYVALARRLGAPLVTADAKLARACRRRARVVLLDQLRE